MLGIRQGRCFQIYRRASALDRLGAGDPTLDMLGDGARLRRAEDQGLEISRARASFNTGSGRREVFRQLNRCAGLGGAFIETGA
ncbi:MAG: hypothetical protein H7039_21715 [Bryobacteraceae bacterium]|nr:hypothetical protein [Bryobacteraceae bacterium]